MYNHNYVYFMRLYKWFLVCKIIIEYFVTYLLLRHVAKKSILIWCQLLVKNKDFQVKHVSMEKIPIFLTVYTENITLKIELHYSGIVLNFNLHTELLTQKETQI